jgi:hypothetical protein
VLSPTGTVVKQADGVLLGSQRKLDQAQSWYAKDSVLLQPAHPFTSESQTPVVPGRTTRYDISLLASFTSKMRRRPSAALKLPGVADPLRKIGRPSPVSEVRVAEAEIP